MKVFQCKQDLICLKQAKKKASTYFKNMSQTAGDYPAAINEKGATLSILQQ